MTKLVHLQLGLISKFDKSTHDKNYQNHAWFGLIRHVGCWGAHICSRSNQLDTPWELDISLAPIPEITHSETRFDIVLDSIAEKFCHLVFQTQRTPYIMWSGGIDSTSILVSLLRVANKELHERLVVVCNQASIDENPYFYHRYIKDRLRTVDTDQFAVTPENYNKILYVNGECAEMIFGSTQPHNLARQGQLDIINHSWQDHRLLSKSMLTTDQGALEFGLDMIKESIKHSPVPIETIHDFLWWHYFNFKINDSLTRIMLTVADQLNDQQATEFWKDSYYLFYMRPEMQIWSMITNNHRREHMHIDYKYDAKNYIYQFDQNDFYRNNKQKHVSLIARRADGHVFAIDQNWRRYSFNRVDDRRLLAKWLGKDTHAG
jgi:hypothetical protein